MIASGVSASRVRSVDELLAHVTVRAQLSPARPKRIAAVWAEWRSGRYAHYNWHAARQALIDVVAPTNGTAKARISAFPRTTENASDLAG
jgi:hypothetical protein